MGTVQVTESVTGNASKVVAVEGAGGSMGYYSIIHAMQQALVTRQGTVGAGGAGGAVGAGGAGGTGTTIEAGGGGGCWGIVTVPTQIQNRVN